MFEGNVEIVLEPRPMFHETEHGYEAGVEAVWQGRAVDVLNCYLCEPDFQKRMEPNAGPLRGIKREGICNPADPTTAFHLTCGHTII